MGVSGTFSGTLYDCLGLSVTVWDSLWESLGQSGTLCGHLLDSQGLSETLWDCPELSGTLWECLGLSWTLCGSFLDCLGLFVDPLGPFCFT